MCGTQKKRKENVLLEGFIGVEKEKKERTKKAPPSPVSFVNNNPAAVIFEVDKFFCCHQVFLFSFRSFTSELFFKATPTN